MLCCDPTSDLSHGSLMFNQVSQMLGSTLHMALWFEVYWPFEKSRETGCSFMSKFN